MKREEEKGEKEVKKRCRRPCCYTKVIKKGMWSPEEDEKLITYINKHGHGNWTHLPDLAGLCRCGKSCRLRWVNYLTPGIKRGLLTEEEEKLVIQLHAKLGNRWAVIASQLPGRTDNEIKNLWNSNLRKLLPLTYKPLACSGPALSAPAASAVAHHMAQCGSARPEAGEMLSRGSSINSPTSSPAKTDYDYFLRIWNSPVGESFRNINNGQKTACQSPVSQPCTSNKCESVSVITADMETSNAALSSKVEEAAMDGIDSTKSTPPEEDLTLQLMLDFPIDNE